MTTPVGGQLVGDAHINVNANTDPALRALSRFSRDANGRLRNLRGQFVSEGRLINGALTTAAGGGDRFAVTLKQLKTASLLLSPALIPIAAQAVPIAAGMGAAAAAVGAFAAAAAGQVPAITEATDAEKKYQDAIKEHGRASKQATDAEANYLRKIAGMPPATRQATASLLVLKEEFRGWSDDLAEFTMVPVTKGLDLTRALLPKLTPLVRGTSQEFSHFLDVLAGATQTPAFDRFMANFTEFATGTLSKATTALVRFTQGANTGEIGANLRQFLAYARENGPLVADTFKQLLTAASRLLVGFSDLGVSTLTAVNALAKLVNAVPASWISTLVQAYAALRLVRLGIAGVTAAASAGAVAQLTAFARAARFGGVGSAIQGVTQRMSTLQKVGGSLGVLGVVAFAIDALADKARGAPPDVDKLSTSLKTLAASGRWTGELKATFGDMDGFITKIRQIDQGTRELDAAKPFLDLAPGGPIVEQLAGKVDDLVNGTKSLGATKEDVKSFDQSFAAMATSGHASIAAEQFRQFESALKASGKSTAEIKALFPEYTAAVAGVKAEQELAAKGMGLFGQQAVATGEKLKMQKQSADGLRAAIVALNDANRSAYDSQISFEAALDNLTASFKEHGNTLNIDTEAGRANGEAMSAAAKAHDEMLASGLAAGNSLGSMTKKSDQLRASMMRLAVDAFDGNKKKAREYINTLLGTPKEVRSAVKLERKDALTGLQNVQAAIKKTPGAKSIKVSTLNAAAIKALEAVGLKTRQLPDGRTEVFTRNGGALGPIGDVRRALDRLDGKTSTTYVRTRYSATYDSNAARPFRRDGGPAPKFAGGGMPGGMLRGPGTGTSDSIPMWWGSNGEYIINARSTAKYRRLIEAINSDTLGARMKVAAPRGVPSGVGTSAGSVPAVARTRTGRRDNRPVTVVNHITLNLENNGAIGSKLELHNWLAKALDDLRRTGRLPGAL